MSLVDFGRLFVMLARSGHGRVYTRRVVIWVDWRGVEDGGLRMLGNVRIVVRGLAERFLGRQGEEDSIK